MLTVAQWLFSAVGPLFLRIMAALGMVLVSWVGVREMMDSLIQQAQTSWGAMPAAMAGLIGVSGLPSAVGMMLGAIQVRVAMWLTAKATQWVGKAG